MAQKKQQNVQEDVIGVFHKLFVPCVQVEAMNLKINCVNVFQDFMILLLQSCHSVINLVITLVTNVVLKKGIHVKVVTHQTTLGS